MEQAGPMTKELLTESGAGLEVNNAFFRKSENAEVRSRSVALVEKWKKEVFIMK